MPTDNELPALIAGVEELYPSERPHGAVMISDELAKGILAALKQAATVQTQRDELAKACRRLMESGCAGGSDHGEMVWDAACAEGETALAKIHSS